MRFVSQFALSLALVTAGLPVAGAAGQDKKAEPEKKRAEEDFFKEKPAVGDRVPDLTVYSPDGKEVKTSSLRGQYVVLTFGCLT